MKNQLLFLAVLILSLILAGGLPLLKAQLSNVKLLPPTSLSVAAAVQMPVELAGISEPLTVEDIAPYEKQASSLPAITDFAAMLANGKASELVGVYVTNQFALPVIQQPANDPSFVSTRDNEVTQFSLAKRYGTTGLLAHNFLSGNQFFRIEEGQEIVLVYGNGSAARYRVTSIRDFQALDPENPYSNFIDVTDPEGKVLTSADLFSKVYTTRGQAILQTCIDANNDPSWGRRFIIASPVDPTPAFFAAPFFSNN